MKFKFKTKKWRDMTIEELNEEKKLGKILTYFGCFAAFLFLILGTLNSMIGKPFAETIGIMALMLVVTLIGVIQTVIIAFEIRFRKLERRD